MKLIALHLTRFKSFRGTSTFKFPQGPGLYFLTGRNELNPKLGANGAGKSTVWDALCWLLFEKTPRSLKAGSIAPWNTKGGVEVALDYEHAGKLYKAVRTWNPNKWWLECDGEKQTLVPDASNLLLAHLGVGFEPFLHSVLMAQGQDMFLDLKSEAMSTLFGKVLDLDHWVDLSSKASKAASLQDTISRSLESKVAEMQGALTELEGSSVQQTYDEWEKDREFKLDELELRHNALMQKRKKLIDSLKGLDTKRDALQADVSKLQSRLDAANTILCASETATNSCEAQLDDVDGDLERAELALKRAQHSTECDACHRPWSVQEQQEREDSLDKEIVRLKRSMSSLSKELGGLQDAEKANRDTVNDLRNTVQSKANSLEGVVQSVKSAEWELASLDKELDRIEADAEELQKRKNPLERMRNDNHKRRKSLEEELLGSRLRLEDSYGQHMLKQFWVKGFKDVRLQEITDALTQLELEVNSEVAQLGLSGWELHFDADMETARGSIKRGFSVKVLSPDNEDLVPWQAWSGGEAQRLRLSGNMGLSNLIRSRMGVSLPLEVWDEPTQFLSPQGVIDLLDALQRRAQEEQRQIWVVDHRSLGYGGFDGVVTVVKDQHGSRFEL